MIRKATFLVFVALFLCSLGTVANASELSGLPVMKGAKEKPCADTDKGACTEAPALRMEVSAVADINGVAKEMLALSKKKGWKMVKVTGTDDPRYMSSNARNGFTLMWSVEKTGEDAASKAKGMNAYFVNYWKIYGE